MEDIRYQWVNGESAYQRKKMLPLMEYEFYEFKEQRDYLYPINNADIGVPYVKGLVSVVLPVYNGEDLISLSIESILKQSYAKFEFIIVDDGSTDSTPEIVDRYAKLDSRIRVIHKGNEKLPKTLSRGFAEARGEFLTWTSADNIMDDDCLEQLVCELERFSDTDMVYANIRVIDENNNRILQNGWYPEKWRPDHVMLLKRITELNTKANNYIGAAFMYRHHVASVIGDYSQYKYGIEDYDYWMKVNSLFQLRHICSEKAIYSYRFHPGSLTAKDKELKITENRYKLMRLDAFRRNYYLKEMIWAIAGNGDNYSIYGDFIEALKQAGHIVITPEDARDYDWGLYSRLIWISFGEVVTDNIPKDAFKILYTNKKDNVRENEWDCLITEERVSNQDFLQNHKGWFSFATGQSMFPFLDAKAKSLFLYDMEREIEKDDDSSEKVSVVLPYEDNLEQLEEAAIRLCEQTISKESYEVIIVAYKDKAEVLRKKLSVLLAKAENIRVLASPEKDIATNYNIGIWEAKGKIVDLYNEAFLCESNYILQVLKCFSILGNISAILGETGSKQYIHPICRTDDLKMVGGLANTYSKKFSSNEMLLPVLELKRVKKTCLEFTDINVMCAKTPALNRKKQSFLENGKVLYDYQKKMLLPYDHWADLIQSNAEIYAKYYEVCGNSMGMERIEANFELAKIIKADLEQRNNSAGLKAKYTLHPRKKTQDTLSILDKYQDDMCKKDEVLVSVIVPVFRVEKYLSRCIESVLNQSIKKIEIILVDDGSDDRCPEICDGYAERDDRVTVIHQRNQGLSAARNQGIAYASGKYIVFVDSDDWIEPEMLEELCLAAEYFDADIAECGYKTIYGDKLDKTAGDSGQYLVLEGDDVLLEEVRWGSFKSVAWNKVYKRKLFDGGLRYPEGKWHEDMFLTYRLFALANRAVYVDYNLYNYDQTRTDSITGAPFSEKTLDTIEAWREKSQFLKKRNEWLYYECLDHYSWVALEWLKKCVENNIQGNRLNQVKKWIEEDCIEFDHVRPILGRVDQIRELLK